jgi:CRP/FNR family transcriptional regulator, cyclic AMP receptor protein
MSEMFAGMASLRSLLDALRPEASMVRRTFGLNEALFHYGDAVDGLHFVEAGEVRLEIVHRDGSVIAADIIGAGEHIGLMDLMAPVPVRTVTARATTTTTTTFVRMRSLTPLLSSPEIVQRIALDLAMRERRGVGRISELTRPRAAGRMAAVLLHQFHSRVRIGTTQHVLASMAGVTRQTASDVIGELVAVGAISRSGRSLRLVDRSVLIEVADG